MTVFDSALLQKSIYYFHLIQKNPKLLYNCYSTKPKPIEKIKSFLSSCQKTKLSVAASCGRLVLLRQETAIGFKTNKQKNIWIDWLRSYWIKKVSVV